MFGADPIDLFDPAPYSALSYYSHIIIGIIGLLAAALAFAVRKGSLLHIRSGQVFIGAIIIVALSSAAMLMTNFIPPLFLAMVSAVYALVGGWLALQTGTKPVRWGEFALFAVELSAVAVFAFVAMRAAAQGIVPVGAPLALLVIPAILLGGDIHWFLNAGKRRALRIARHLSRMIWATIIAVRAPLVELAAGGLPISAPVLVVGPVIIGVVAVWWSRRHFSRLIPAA